MKHAFAKNIHKGEDAWMQHRDLKWGGGGTTASEGTGNLNLAVKHSRGLLAAKVSAALSSPRAPPKACLQHRPQLAVL